MRREAFGREASPRASKRRVPTPRHDATPRTIMRGGDLLRGGRPPAAGHAGRAAIALTDPLRRVVTCLLCLLMAVISSAYSCGLLPALAASQTATVTTTKVSPPVYDRFSLTIDGSSYLAYCAEAVNEAPDSGTVYTAYDGALNIPQLDYVCYHGYDGVTVTSLTAPNGTRLNATESRAATQAAVWLAIGEKRHDIFHYRLRPQYHTNDNLNVEYQINRLATDTLATARALAAAAETYASQSAAVIAASPEAGYATLWTSTALDSDNDNYVQRLILIGQKGGHLELKKGTTWGSLVAGNACYTLEGATYGIYSTAECTELVTTLTCDASGNATSELLPVGSYWLRETAAPTGYVASDAVYPVSVTGGATATVEVDETPAHGPDDFLLQKLDGESAVVLTVRGGAPQGSAQGDATLAGAEFEVRYYAGIFESEADLPADATRSWTFASDEDGIVRYDAEHLVEGDKPYTDPEGTPALPLGTYTMRESAAPEGYQADGTLHIAQLIEDEMSPTGASWKAIGPWHAEGTLDAAEGRGVADQVIRGGVCVGKLDRDLSEATPQGDASLAGASFEIRLASAHDVYVGGDWYRTGQVVATLTTDADGTASTDATYLPYGTYTVRETAAPDGYELNGSWSRTFSIRDQGSIVDLSAVEDATPEQVLRGGVRVGKLDRERNARHAQGDASLDATIAVTLLSEGPVVVEGTTYQQGDTVLTLRCDPATGVAETAADTLPYGSYRLSELAAPEGYLTNTGWYRDFSVRTKGLVVDLSGTSDSVADQVIRGGVRLSKVDRELDAAVPQGDATLAGARYAITLLSEQPVRVDGALCQPESVVATIVTDAEGVAATAADALPYGTYRINEVTAPRGYLLDEGWERTFSVREDGAVVDLTDEPQAEQVIRGGLELQKVDVQNGLAAPQGAASFEGAEFEVVLESEQGVLVDGAFHEHGEVVLTLVTDADGYVSTDATALPYGSYTVRETKAPEGYLLNRTWSRSFSIREEGQIVRLVPEDEGGEPELVVRGDLEGVKVAEADMARLAGVPFVVESETTGEWHVIVTDANGELSTASSWNPHTRATNANDAAVVATEEGYQLAEGAALDGMAGVWFHGRTDADTLLVEDELGALPYDTYRVTELTCAANEGLQLVEVEVTISRDTHTVDLGTLDDHLAPEKPQLETLLLSTEGLSNVAAGESVTLVDEVDCYNLVPGETYLVEGALHLKDASGADAGIVATGSTELHAHAAYGTAYVSFEVSTDDLAGYDLVAFETLSLEDEMLAHHEDLDDSDQTVSIVEIGTTLSSAEGSKEVLAEAETTLVDTVRYRGLVPGQAYEAEGTLYDKASGETVTIDGQPVIARAHFVPDTRDGSVEVVFSFDASVLAGRSVVAFERLLCDDIELAVHADLEDEDQTLHFPRVGTKLTSDEGMHETLAGPVTLTDLVSYEGLTPGLEYVLSGRLIDRESGEALVIDGEEVVAEASFVPEEPNGTVEAHFELDASALAGHDLVAFEELACEGVVVARHADLHDGSQTVRIPRIGTMLINATTGGHLACATEGATFVDTIAYQGLTPHVSYVAIGELHDAATGEALMYEGQALVASTEFVPEEEDGTVEVTFTLDARVFAGHAIVAFERAEREGVPVAEHADQDDEDQTVWVPRVSTTATDAAGEHLTDASKECELIDTVTYTGLIPGKTYELRGTLMDRETGEPLATKGATARCSFVAEDASGKVALSFVLDAETLHGRSIVAFEELSCEGELVGEHRDLEDEGQTVSFRPAPETPKPAPTTPEEKTPEKTSTPKRAALPKTGDLSLPWLAVGICGLALLAVGIAARVRASGLWRR